MIRSSPYPWRFVTGPKLDCILDANTNVIGTVVVADFHVVENGWLFANAPRMLELIADFVANADYLAEQGELTNSEPLMEARALLLEARAFRILDAA